MRTVGLPRAWVVKIVAGHVDAHDAPRHVHAEELVFSLGLLAFVLWLTLRVLS